MYRGGFFNFTFVLNNNFPHEAPKVKCTQKIYHPNIDLAGNVCLNILREDWTPVLNLNAVMIGLQVCAPVFPKWMLMLVLPVPIPRTERRRSAEHGGCRRHAVNRGEFQGQRLEQHGGRLCQGHPV